MRLRPIPLIAVIGVQNTAMISGAHDEANVLRLAGFRVHRWGNLNRLKTVFFEQ